MKRAVTVAAGALLLTACGGTAAAHPAQSAANVRNVRVCEHYRTQRTIVLNDATPDLAEALKVAGWISVDQGQAQPGTPLARDLGRVITAVRHGGGGTHAAYQQVVRDCEALGVKFSR